MGSEMCIRDRMMAAIKDALRQARPPQGLPPDQVVIWRKNLEKQLMHDYGLDRPPWEKIFFRLRDVLFLNFGKADTMKSFVSQSREVKDIILEALPNTVILFTTAQIIIIFVGIILGLQAARRAGGILDRVISLIAMISYSLPMWWVGMIMLMVFSYQLNIFPSQASLVYEAIRSANNSIEYLQIWIYYMALPLITVVLVSFGGMAYITRNIVLGVLQEDYIMAARAKGLPERRVLYGHVLRSASPPIVTMSALGIIGSLGGAIITETVFGWPGMGRVYWIAIQRGEIYVVLANTFMTVFLFVTTLVILDLIYGLLDPRVRIS